MGRWPLWKHGGVSRGWNIGWSFRLLVTRPILSLLPWSLTAPIGSVNVKYSLHQWVVEKNIPDKSNQGPRGNSKWNLLQFSLKGYFFPIWWIQYLITALAPIGSEAQTKIATRICYWFHSKAKVSLVIMHPVAIHILGTWKHSPIIISSQFVHSLL